MKRLLLVILLTIVTHTHAGAQSSEYLFWTARVYGGQPLLPQPRTFALYEPLGELTIELTIKNEGNKPILVDSGAFVLGTTAELLESGAQVPINVDWDLEFQDPLQNASIPWAPGVQHLLAADAVLVWKMRLRPGGGVREGQYTVVIDLGRAVQTALRRTDGETWGGRATPRTVLTVHLRGVRTPAESARSDQARGQLALRERRYDDAVTAFLRAAAGGAADGELSSNLGMAYLGMGSYAEATKWLERATAMTRPGAHSALPELLAQAYVGNGNEAAADKILRSRGRSASEAALEIQRLRGLIAQRAKR